MESDAGPRVEAQLLVGGCPGGKPCRPVDVCFLQERELRRLSGVPEPAVEQAPLHDFVESLIERLVVRYGVVVIVPPSEESLGSRVRRHLLAGRQRIARRGVDARGVAREQQLAVAGELIALIFGPEPQTSTG